MQQYPNSNQPPPSFPPPPFMFPPMPLLPMQGMPPQQPPNPPQDPEQKNIIDKLANFVARNGPEFENVTREKQKDNPKFQFLFGGDFHQYYQFKLNLERELIRFQSLGPPPPTQPPQFNQPPPFLQMPPGTEQTFMQIAGIQAKINGLKEQITQSEKNLKAQDEFLNSKKKIQLEETLKQIIHDKFTGLLQESNLNLNEFEQYTNRIIQVCTKDAIATGRMYVLDKNLTDKKIETICYYLTQKIVNKDSTNEARLHLIYFMNDLVHHGNKKGIEMVKRNLEKVIIPCFCYATEKTDNEKRTKMNKLLEIWEKNNYFSPNIIEKLRNPSSGIKYYEDSILAENNEQIKSMDNELDSQFKQYEYQHNEYVQHTQNQITSLQNQINQLMQQSMPVPPMIPPLMQQQAPQMNQSQNSQQGNKLQPLMSLMSIPFENKGHQNQQKSLLGPPPTNLQPIQPQQPTPLMSIKSNVPTGPPNNIIIPTPLITNLNDLTKPPPDSNKQADVPYYNLPAGLLVSLIKLEDRPYEPINPKNVKLPPPAPVNETVMKAVDEFYELLNNPKNRNSEGWEKDGLYDFYKSKLKILTEKENVKRRSRSRSYSSYSSRSRSRSRRRRRRRSYSYSSSSRSSSRSRRRRSSSSSYSRSRSKTPKRRSKSRSPTPPNLMFTSAPISAADKRLDTSNKGFQLLQKSGWSGATGLGKQEQGIINPIEGGEVRDKTDMYRGIGVRSDPFEAFRKNKSVGYIQRMKDRDAERAIVRKSIGGQPGPENK